MSHKMLALKPFFAKLNKSPLLMVNIVAGAGFGGGWTKKRQTFSRHFSAGWNFSCHTHSGHVYRK